MINYKTANKCVILAVMLTAVFACILIMSSWSVYADDQADGAQPQTEAAASEAPAETKAPAQKAAPAENKAPAQTSAPAETAAPIVISAPAETAAPTETAAPAETAAPTQTEAPAETSAPAEQSAASPAPEPKAVSQGAERAAADTAAPPAATDKVSAPAKEAKESASAIVFVSEGEDAKDGEEPSEEETFDITEQVVANLRYDEESGVLSWDAIAAPSDRTIRYYIYLKADNIKNPSYKIYSGVKAQKMNTTETSVNVDSLVEFKDSFTNFEGADYTFYVRATDGTTEKDGRGRFTKETESAVYSMSHYKLEVIIYTRVRTYNKSKKQFSSDLRRVTLSQGGEIVMNGKSLNKVKGGDGTEVNEYNASRAVKSGTAVNLEYLAADGYRLAGEKFDGGKEDKSPATTRSFTMDKAHKIVLYFEQPFADIITSGIEASSDNFEDIADNMLSKDADSAGMKSGVEGYMQMKVKKVGAGSLSVEDRNICDNDFALRSKNIKSGQFFEVSLYKSLDRAKPSKFSKTTKPVELKISVPDSLKNSDKDVRRTFYLIRVNNGDAVIIADGTLDELSGYITDSGLYMIGYKDTRLTGLFTGGGGAGAYEAYAADEAAPEPAAAAETGTEPDVQEISEEGPVISPSEPVKNEADFPVKTVAGVAAVVMAGAYGLRRFLAVVLRLL